MDKIKCLVRHIDGEITDAWGYAKQAYEWDREGHEEAARHLEAMAHDEIDHARTNLKLLVMIAEKNKEHADMRQALEIMREFTKERIKDAEEGIREMLGER